MFFLINLLLFFKKNRQFFSLNKTCMTHWWTAWARANYLLFSSHSPLPILNHAGIPLHNLNICLNRILGKRKKKSKNSIHPSEKQSSISFFIRSFHLKFIFVVISEQISYLWILSINLHLQYLCVLKSFGGKKRVEKRKDSY